MSIQKTQSPMIRQPSLNTQPMPPAQQKSDVTTKGVHGEKSATFKQLGNDKNQLTIGQAKLEGDAFVKKGKGEVHAQANGNAQLTGVGGKGELSHEGKLGKSELKGDFHLGAEAKGKAEAGASLQDAKLYGNAEGEVNAGLKAAFEASQTKGQVGASVDGSVFGGAKADGHAKAEFDPKNGTALVDIGGKAMAGSEQQLNGKFKLGPLEVKGGISAEQGVSAHGNLKAGVENGCVKFGVDSGATLGIGAGSNFEVSLDTKAIADAVKNVAPKVQEGAQKLGQVAQQGAQQVGQVAQQGAQKLQQGTQQMGQAMQQGAQQVGQVAQQGAQKLQQGTQQMGQAMQQGAQQVGQVAQQGAQKLQQGTQQMGQAMQHGAQKLQQGTQQVGQQVGQKVQDGAHKLQESAQKVGQKVKEGLNVLNPHKNDPKLNAKQAA